MDGSGVEAGAGRGPSPRVVGKVSTPLTPTLLVPRGVLWVGPRVGWSTWGPTREGRGRTAHV